MIRFNQCYSLTLTAQMNRRKVRSEKIRAGLKDIIYIFLFIVMALSISHKTQTVTVPLIQKQVVSVPVAFAKTDDRVTKLQAFLNSKNSPMAPYAKLIVEQSDKNAIDFTQIAAISCMESACGTKLPNGSYNAWGLGGSNFMHFHSWTESITYVSSLLGQSYKQNVYQAIKQNYCPDSDGCNTEWAPIVTDYSNQILTTAL